MKKLNSCPLCKSGKKYQTLEIKKVYGDNSNKKKFYRCNNCKVYYLNPRLSKIEEKKLYEKDFEKFMCKRSNQKVQWNDIKKHEEINRENIKRRFKYINSYLKKRNSILEYGCSSGFMLRPLIKRGLNCYGIEPSNKFYDILSNNRKNIFKNEKDLLKKNPNKKFDIIMHFFVMEHIVNIRDFLLKQNTLLKNNGIILAEIPNYNDPLNIIYKTRSFDNFYWSVVHPYYFNEESLKYLLDDMGFKYKIIRNQRYDLSNHINWLLNGKPGGQKKFYNIFKNKAEYEYKKSLIQEGLCDTLIAVIYKKKLDKFTN